MAVATVVTALGLILGLIGPVSSSYESCEPRGYWKKPTLCMCKKDMEALAMVRVFTRDATGAKNAFGFFTTEVSHGRCVDWRWESKQDHVGKRNHHPAVRPLHTRDDRESLLQDDKVRTALDDHNITTFLGSFDRLQHWFPSCKPPKMASEQPTLEAGARIARDFVQGCSSKWLWARQFHSRKDLNSVILAGWLAFRPDSQRLQTISCNDPGYLAEWYESIMTLGLRAIVFHDCVPQEVVSVLQNSLVSFKRISINKTSQIHADQTPNDVRFVLFSEYLESTDASFDHILATDMHDVRLSRNPFAAMRARDDIEIFIGQDRLAYKNNVYTWEVLEWCAPAYAHLPYDPRVGERMTLNCGVVGGKGSAMRRLLRHVVALYRNRRFERHMGIDPWERYCDMAMFAIALMGGYETLHEDVWLTPANVATLNFPYRYDSGPPFTSHFLRHSTDLTSYVQHK